MCLAIYKQKGVKLDEEFLRESILSGYISNKDGFGFAIKRHNNHKSELEFFRTVPLYGKEKLTIEQCIDKLFSKNIGEDDEVMIHLRMGTSGKVIDENTHPFICDPTTKTDNLLEGTINYPMIIHNGVFSRTAYEITNKDMCDTYHVAKQFFSVPVVPYLVMKKRNWMKTLFDRFLSGKVCYMSNNPQIETFLFGDWPFQEKGIMFSNSAYKNRNYYSSTFHNHSPFVEYDNENDYYDNYEEYLKSFSKNKKENFQLASGKKTKKKEILGVLGNIEKTTRKVLSINSLKSFFELFDKKFDINGKIIFDRKKNKGPISHVMRGVVISYHYVNPGAMFITNNAMKCTFKVGMFSKEIGELPSNTLIIIEDLNVELSTDNKEIYDAVVIDLNTLTVKYYISVSLEEILDSCDPLYYCSNNFNCLESTSGQISYSTIPSAALFYEPFRKNKLESTQYLVDESKPEFIDSKSSNNSRKLIKLEKDDEVLNYNNWSRSRYKKFKKALNSALSLNKNLMEIKLNSKKYGPYQTTFIEKLINQYEKKNVAV